MATTADDLTPILRSKLKAALYELSDKGNMGGWRDHIADDIGVDRKTAENWFYGNNLPSLAGWVALCLRVPGVQDLVLGDLVENYVPLRTNPELRAKIQKISDELSTIANTPIPHEGKVS